LGRSLEKTIIIDNLAENFIHTTPENGIWVESWYDDMDDTVLEILLPFLISLVTERVADIRKVLTKDIKEKTLYRCLEEGKAIPTITELLMQSHQK
jgi:TFIIF-interacting CTD phosphatase-like protein